jgi:hypothetical protein
MNNPTTIYDFYKLKKYIDPKRLYWWKFELNEDSIPFIEKHIGYITSKESLKQLSRNPFAVDMLEKHMDKISWNDFVNNPNAIRVIEKNIDLCFNSLNWRGRRDLLRHPNFIHIIKENTEKIINNICSECLSVIASNTNPIYIDLLEQYMKKYPEKIENNFYYWRDLCENPSAIRIVERYLDKLPDNCWAVLANNPNAVHIIEKNLDKLGEWGWHKLSENPNAIHILEENIDKIDWYNLSQNPNCFQIFEKYPEKIISYSFSFYNYFSVNSPIFDIDYDAIQKRCSIYKEELMEVALHPSRIEVYLQQGIPASEIDNYI